MRFQSLRPLSLEALLAWAFGSLIVGSALAAALAFAVWRLADTAFDEYERQDAPIALHASKGVDAWLKVRSYEESLIVSQGGTVGPAEATARYVPLWKSGVDDIRIYLTEIRRAADESDQRVVALLPGLEPPFERYTSSFMSFVDSMVRLGDADSGLDGEMGGKARAAEMVVAQIKSPALTESLQNLSRIRTAFVLTRKEQYVKEFVQEAARLERYAASAPQRQRLLPTIKEYGALFNEYVRVRSDMEIKKRDLLETGALLASGLEQLEHETLQNTHERLQVLERHITNVALLSASIALVAVVLGAVSAAFAGARIRIATRRVIGFAVHVAAGRLATRLHGADSGEFGALEAALNTMADRLQEIDKVMNREARALEASNRRIALLSEMTGLLQIAVNLTEAAEISARYLSQIHLARAGALYLYDDTRSYLDAIARWGKATAIHSFGPGDCWALRSGQPYGLIEANAPLVCAHATHDNKEALYLCLPMVTRGGMLGLLYVVFEESDSAVREDELRFARRLAEQLGLALANLELRETLREQSVRDPLTKLFNRRFLEESLTREFARAIREKGRIAVLMIDVDHFKRFNDAHGHEGGDAALRQLGVVLEESCRATDLACRFGGEEFTVVLPGTTREGAQAWTERLLNRVREMEIVLPGTAFSRLTVSVGIALYPDHGEDVDTVLQAADRALYDAKRSGRDQVVVTAE